MARLWCALFRHVRGPHLHRESEGNKQVDVFVCDRCNRPIYVEWWKMRPGR